LLKISANVIPSNSPKKHHQIPSNPKNIIPVIPKKKPSNPIQSQKYHPGHPPKKTIKSHPIPKISSRSSPKKNHQIPSNPKNIIPVIPKKKQSNPIQSQKYHPGHPQKKTIKSHPIPSWFSLKSQAVNNATGAQTQLAGLVTSLVMLRLGKSWEKSPGKPYGE